MDATFWRKTGRKDAESGGDGSFTGGEAGCGVTAVRQVVGVVAAVRYMYMIGGGGGAGVAGGWWMDGWM